jgi:MATE family multidrug resistance protein
VPAESDLWRAELAQTIRLAVPIALTQLGQIVMMTTDLVLIGRLGDEALAAAALAHTVLFAAFTLGMGLVSAVSPLASQAYGARQPRMVRRALRVGLWAAVILGVPMTLVQFWGEDILVELGQTVGRDGWSISDGTARAIVRLIHRPAPLGLHRLRNFRPLWTPPPSRLAALAYAH